MKEYDKNIDSEILEFKTLYIDDLFKLSTKIIEDNIESIDGIFVLGDIEFDTTDIFDSIIYVLENEGIYNKDKCIIASKILNKEYSQIQHIPCNRYLLTDVVESDIFIFKRIIQRIKRRMRIETSSDYERDILGSLIHGQLKDNPDYVDHNIILDISDERAVNLYIFDECKDIPDLKL